MAWTRSARFAAVECADLGSLGTAPLEVLGEDFGSSVVLVPAFEELIEEPKQGLHRATVDIGIAEPTADAGVPLREGDPQGASPASAGCCRPRSGPRAARESR
jgi:hypothetical protein